MASVKIFSLAVKTLAKPIANTIKAQATQHETFRNFCISLAQGMHRTEARMRMGLLNEEAKNIKPLNDTRAVQNGATTLAESFLFLVGAGLVLGESYRSSRKEGKRRDEVQDRLENLEEELKSVRRLLSGGSADEVDTDGGGGLVWEKGLAEIREQNANIEKVLTTIVNNGLRAGWLSLGHQDGDVMTFAQQSLASRPLLNGQKTNATSIEEPQQGTEGLRTMSIPPPTVDVSSSDS